MLKWLRLSLKLRCWSDSDYLSSFQVKHVNDIYNFFFFDFISWICLFVLYYILICFHYSKILAVILLMCLRYYFCSFHFTYSFACLFLLISYARVMGQMAILTMSFLTFPVAHNSVWESVFGVPFDRSEIIHVNISHVFDYKILMCNI